MTDGASEARRQTDLASPRSDVATRIAAVRTAVTGPALATGDARPLMEALAAALFADPAAATRISVAYPTIHPLVRARDHIWTREDGVVENDYVHAEMRAPVYLRSPLRHVVENGIPLYRHRLDTPDPPFQAFADLAAMGRTDYIAAVVPFDGSTGGDTAASGVFLSVCTDKASGFDADDVTVLTEVRDLVALAFRIVIERSITRAVATTYLGVTAAEKVLSGAIRRGDAQTIEAVIWYSDLRRYTSLSEELSAEAAFAFLNETFEATASPVMAHGGEVLDFIGDAVLGIFPGPEGVARALTALDDALGRLDEVRTRHADSPVNAIAETVAAGFVGIGLARGEVRFGNIGVEDRLSFSVIGPAVNRVARIEAMTKTLQEPALIAGSVAAASDRRFRPCGTHELRGVSEPQELFAPLRHVVA